VQLDQGTCNGGASQQWLLNSAGGSGYTLTNVGSGLDADVFGASTSAGAQVDQWPGNGGANQIWNFS